MTVMYGYTDVAEQAWMVLDEARLRAFREAIARVVQPGDVVLDAGAGNGLLSLLAAKAGAAKVFAVERSGAIELASAHIKENGFEDRVETVRADLLELKHGDLTPSPNVVISEMLGHFAPGEALHRVTRHALRLCREGARTVPQSYEVFIAAAHPLRFMEELAFLRDLGGLSMGTLADRLNQRPRVGPIAASDLAGPGASAGVFAVDDETPERFVAQVEVEKAGPVTGVAAWFKATLAPGVTLETAPGAERTHWQPMFLPIAPALECSSGDVLEVEIRPRLITQRGTYVWRVARGSEVRRGDAMKSLVGTKEDTLADLGIGAAPANQLKASPRLDAWVSMLAAGAPSSVEEMVGRLRAALPERFPDDDAAVAEARRLLLAAEALS